MKKIGRYEICGLLGKGSMSTVYKARVPVIGKVVALKLLKPHPHLLEQLGAAALGQRFTAEAILMARLHHPHLVEVWDFDECNGQLFFVMEYYCNNLGRLIGETYRLEDPSRPLPVPEVLRYGSQVLKGLARLHQGGIIHRDIKPFNILLTDQDRVKISDFGMSRLRGEHWRGPSTLMVGSPYYAAPEQEKHADAADARSDLYAVGVMLYRMLTGQLPEHPPSPVGRHRPGLDPAWDGFFRRATAVNPADRHGNARQMRAALLELQQLWERQVRLTCAEPVPVAEPAPAASAATSAAPRQGRLKVSPAEARQQFNLDQLWRPRSFPANDFDRRGNGIVVDRSSGLVWQQAGSDYPLTRQEALEYVARLNREGFAGIGTWRLPAVTELLALVTPQPTAGITCVPPIFATTQRRLWSSDLSSFTAAWYMSADLGFVDRQDFTCRCHVRAVS